MAVKGGFTFLGDLILLVYNLIILDMDRGEVIQEAIKIANREGLEELTLGALARSLGVKTPSLYHYIQNLQELHDELGILCIEGLTSLILKDSYGLSGENALRQFCFSSRSFALQNRGLYEAMQLTHLKRSKAYQKSAENLLGLLAGLFAQFAIKPNHRVHAIRYLRSLLHGFIDLELKNGFGMPDDLNRSFELAIEAFLLSLQKYNQRKTKWNP